MVGANPSKKKQPLEWSTEERERRTEENKQRTEKEQRCSGVTPRQWYGVGSADEELFGSGSRLSGIGAGVCCSDPKQPRNSLPCSFQLFFFGNGGDAVPKLSENSGNQWGCWLGMSYAKRDPVQPAVHSSSQASNSQLGCAGPIPGGGGVRCKIVGVNSAGLIRNRHKAWVDPKILKKNGEI